MQFMYRFQSIRHPLQSHHRSITVRTSSPSNGHRLLSTFKASSTTQRSPGISSWPRRSDDRERLLERYDDHRFVTAPRDGHILTVQGSWSYSGRNTLEIMSCFDIDFACSFCVWPDDQDPIEDSCSRTWISIFYNKCNGGILGGRLGGDMMSN